MFNSKAAPRSLTPDANGYSIAAAKYAATQLAIAHQNSVIKGGGGIKVELTRDAARRKAVIQAADKLKDKTVAKLGELYASTLTNKKTASDARGVFKHIPPHIARMPAAAVTRDNWIDTLTEVMSHKAAAGTKVTMERTANKLRAYLCAAYNKALHRKVGTPPAFKDFGIKTNHLATIEPYAQANGNVDNNPFKLRDMRIYWGLIKDVSGVEGAVLRIHLATGGLRLAQLLRLRANDYDEEQGVFTLVDGKGRRAAPRKYVTPVPLIVQKDFDYLLTLNEGNNGFIFSTDGGTKPIWDSTLRQWARDIVGTTIEDFRLKRIRSGCETELSDSSLNVPEEVRAQLHSHSMSSVIRRNYNNNTYTDAKRDALAKWVGLITQAPPQGKVIKIGVLKVS
jgi:integrase